MKPHIETLSVQGTLTGSNSLEKMIGQPCIVREVWISIAGFNAPGDTSGTAIFQIAIGNAFAGNMTEISATNQLCFLHFACGEPAATDTGAIVANSQNIICHPNIFVEANMKLLFTWSTLLTTAVVSAAVRLEYQ